MKFIAIQTGARRGYAVPRILDEAGILERFYTDICGSVGLGRAATWLQHAPVVGAQFRGLYRRRLPSSLVPKTTTFGGPASAQLLRTIGGNGDAARAFRNHLRFSGQFGQAMIRAGYGNATHVFSMLGEGGPFLKEAKRRGLTVVSEVYILISTERILADERKAYPRWEPSAPDFAALRRELTTDDYLFNHSDYFVCPSESVRDDLVTNLGIADARACLVPYGVDPTWLELPVAPVPRRILFVGTAELRKGIHYLAMAAELLKSRGHQYEFRVAGHVARSVAEQPPCRHLTFLGRVPRDRVREEFQHADVFVLPSLAEGSAEVTYEALAAGLPVVTTRAAGSVIRDGIEGKIVPERDPAALAEAIAQTVENRDLREKMSVAARERARDHTWDCYGQRLISVLRNLNRA
jgi:glycosyltransferase involved in cell wall biosynthesis